MLVVLLKKMLSNKWMFMCLLIGSVIMVSMVSSIPMFTSGILQRTLIKDLEGIQKAFDSFPGQYTVKANFDDPDNTGDAKGKAIEGYAASVNGITNRLGLPVLSRFSRYTAKNMYLLPSAQQNSVKTQAVYKVESISDIRNHVSILSGRMFSGGKSGNTYEVIVTAGAMENAGLKLNETYDVYSYDDGKVQFKVKVVGVFKQKDPSDLYWDAPEWSYNSSFIMDEQLFDREFVKSGSKFLTTGKWVYNFDYHKITIDNVMNILSAYNKQDALLGKNKYTLEKNFGCVQVITDYGAQAKELNSVLWILLIPVFVMLALYILMVSQLIIKHDENEIAVFKSRGASKWKIFKNYIAECLVLCVITLLIGPFAGLGICKIIGSTNGFLEFVQRSSLDTHLSFKAYLYSAVSLLFFAAAMLFPAYKASAVSIVQYKQSLGKRKKFVFWKSLYLDVILIGISMYCYFNFSSFKKIAAKTGSIPVSTGSDPIIFLLFSVFLLGVGLLFIRIYPFLVYLIFSLGKRFWSPPIYVSILQALRSGGQEHFLLLFVMFTVSLGIFNANTARTLDQNYVDQIRYQSGADIVIKPFWYSNQGLPQLTQDMADTAVNNDKGTGNGGDNSSAADGGDNANKKETAAAYIEPSFKPYTELKGVELATKVYNYDNAAVSAKGQTPVENVKFLGIRTSEFGKISSMRDKLLPVHWYSYLNLIAESPSAMLLSTSFKNEFNLTEGDTIYVKIGDNAFLPGKVYAFVNYWPATGGIKSEKAGGLPHFVIANFDYIHRMARLGPYEIWLKKKAGATDEEITSDLVKKNIQITDIRYTRNEIIEKRNDPRVQSTNGALTFGFIIMMAIVCIGFTIFWILSIKKRVFQFGIFRAMGMTLKNLIMLLMCDQLLISTIALAAGVVTGNAASKLLLPLIRITAGADSQILPLKVYTYRGDYIKLLVIICILMLSVFAILGIIVSRIRIDQAVKMGEE